MACPLKDRFVSKTFIIMGIFLFLNTKMIFCQALIESQKVVNFYHMYDVRSVVYSQPGDINIGDVTQVYYNNGFYKCNDEVQPWALTDHTEAIKYAVDWVNKQPDLLPNVTLGFVLRGSCLSSYPMAMANALFFLPQNKPICNSSTCTLQSKMTSSDIDYVNNDDVIGMLSPTSSDLAAIFSYLFSMSRVPIVGYKVGGEELGSTRYHRHFFAINTKSYNQVRGMLKFISVNSWSYIQFIYPDNHYGKDVRKYVYEMAGEYGICIAASHVLTTYKASAKALMTKPRARVVIIFLTNWPFNKILKEIIPLKVSGHFLFIGSDKMENFYYSHPKEPIDPGVGTFIFFPYMRVVNEYYDYVKSIDVYKTKNPWLKEAWESLRGCSYEECPRNESETLNFNPRKTASLRMDAVLTFAYAAHNLLQDHCPGVTGMEARTCITGDLLTEYLRMVKFDGFSGSVEFYNQGIVGKFIIFQTEYNVINDRFHSTGRKRVNHIPVAVYDGMSDNITYLGNLISWSNFNTLERIVPISNDSLAKNVPESVCSRPCVVGEYKIEKDLPCCWDCLRCRNNERLINENTGCERCPLFQWPDPFSNFTTCVDIPLTYQTMKDPIPIALVSITGFVLTFILFVYSAYVKYRNERVIKASSKELSFIQLVGISGGYVTVILFQTTPTDIMCRFIFFLFCMSFAMLYSPLLVKTVRIFRIFRSASENKKPGFISPQSQLIISILLITIQLLVCGAVYFLYVPGARRTQPVWSEKMVELSCDFTIPGLASFLGYNILLVALCSVFAFMVRKLPDNYNESRFISMCVSTTLLIWMAFIPTYFTADREYMRMFLLCMALLLNHSVALVLLFFPRIHAAAFMKDESLNFAMKK